MEIAKFPEANVTFAEGQPEYMPLPAFKADDEIWGQVVCLWKANWKDRIRILWTGKIWVSLLTFNRPLQPIKLQTEYPFNVTDGRP